MCMFASFEVNDSFPLLWTAIHSTLQEIISEKINKVKEIQDSEDLFKLKIIPKVEAASITAGEWGEKWEQIFLVA